MAIPTRWEPFRDLARLQDEMTRLFDDRAYRSGESVGWTPSCDIFEDEDGLALRFELAGVDPKDVDIQFEDEKEIIVKAELPEMKKEDVKVTVDQGILTISGERKLEKEDKRENYHRIELAYGTFTRTFSLPSTVDAEKIRAEAKNGMLTVHLPKRVEAKPRAIQVKVGA